MKDKLRYAQLLVLDTPFAREQEVQSGRADVFMTDYPYSERFLANADWARLERFVSDVKRDGRLLASAKRYQLEPIVAP